MFTVQHQENHLCCKNLRMLTFTHTQMSAGMDKGLVNMYLTPIPLKDGGQTCLSVFEEQIQSLELLLKPHDSFRLILFLLSFHGL